jgi:hypothetical protein
VIAIVNLKVLARLPRGDTIVAAFCFQPDVVRVMARARVRVRVSVRVTHELCRWSLLRVGVTETFLFVSEVEIATTLRGRVDLSCTPIYSPALTRGPEGRGTR